MNETQSIETSDGTTKALAAATPKAKPNGKLDPNAVFGIDKHLAADGFWAVIDGYKFKIAQMNNSTHEAYLSRMGEVRQRTYTSGRMDPEDFQREHGRLVAHSFLRDWDERFVDFSTERAADFCIKNPHITSQIVQIAGDYHNYLQRDRELDSKNS